MLDNAVRICDASFGNLYRPTTRVFRLPRRTIGTPPAYAEYAGNYVRFNDTGRPSAASCGEDVHVPDIADDPAYRGIRRGCGEARRRADRFLVPMLKEDELIGAMSSIARRSGRSPRSRSRWSKTSPPRPSSPSRIRGCSMNCGSARRPDESLEQQTATSEVLSVISSSPGELSLSSRHAGECGANLRCEIRHSVPIRRRCVLRRGARSDLPPAVENSYRQRGPCQANTGSALDRLWDEAGSSHADMPTIAGTGRSPSWRRAIHRCCADAQGQ